MDGVRLVISKWGLSQEKEKYLQWITRRYMQRHAGSPVVVSKQLLSLESCLWFDTSHYVL